MESDDLIRSLRRKLFQAETSTLAQCRLEAKRLDGTEPASALRHVSDHVESVLQELTEFAPEHGGPASVVGVALGQIFSATCEFLADRLIPRESSYRGVLIGIRDGLDLVRLMIHCAERQENGQLANWCGVWLQTRSELAAELERGLVWFANHPDFSMQIAAHSHSPAQSIQRRDGHPELRQLCGLLS